MPPDHRPGVQNGFIDQPRRDANPQWKAKPLTPTQLLVHDVKVATLRRNGSPRLEVHNLPSWSLVPDHAATQSPLGHGKASDAASNPIQKRHFERLEEEYGWIRHLRLDGQDDLPDSSEQWPKCRWIHCSAKFPEYLTGFLWALSEDSRAKADLMQCLDNTVQQHTRFSKHGKYFSPFSTSLQSPGDSDEALYPMLMSVPFLDWSVHGTPPGLRFQVDKREGSSSTKSSVHLLRSILQHFYRLEDTRDRENDQVFSKHKPWNTDRELDLKIRQWYGHYPTALNVDELWVLVVDEFHIVTFSSNQTWKSIWPPHQLASRISDISFRGIRNTYFASQEGGDFTAITQAIVALNAAVGLTHRNFWPDYLLPTTDRYAGYLSHLQYRLHRAPSTKLVMDLIACQEELNIVIQITEQQIEMLNTLLGNLQNRGHDTGYEKTLTRGRLGHAEVTSLREPTLQIIDNLQRELADLLDLRDNTDRLVTRTIQLVNIRLEDHGKAILVFTVVTIIFLPLNFVSSFFGMNVSDIRDLQQGQWLFWAVALCITTAVVGGSVFLAFSGGDLWHKFVVWRDKKHELRLSTTTALRQTAGVSGQGFRVLNP